MRRPSSSLTCLLLALLLTVGFGSLATAQTPPVTPSAATMQLLAAYHELPTADAFKAASPKTARAELLTVARDPQRFRAHRYRALEALAAYWPDDEVFGLYEVLLKAPDDADLPLQLMPLAARAFGARVLPLLSPWLDDADAQLRASAVDALARLDTPEARATLQRRAEVERDPFVKARLASALRVLR